MPVYPARLPKMAAKPALQKGERDATADPPAPHRPRLPPEPQPEAPRHRWLVDVDDFMKEQGPSIVCRRETLDALD
jgi:hypothetical protein